MLTTDIRKMPMSMISSMGNFLPKKGSAVVNQIVNWVVVGEGGIIAKSTDGNVWTPAAGAATVKGGINTYGTHVAYGKDGLGVGLWVAVGQGGLIAKSTNGSDWTPAAGSATNKGDITSSGQGVAYGKNNLGVGLWVAVGEGGIIAKSTDGNVWTPTYTSPDGSKGGVTSPGMGVAYGKDGTGAGLWVAVGDGGIIAQSTDGNVWTPAATKGGITYGYGVAYGKDGNGAGLWVAVGQGSIIAKSPNGTNWTAAYTSVAGNVGGITTTGMGVAYGKDGTGAGLWVAVGQGGIIAKSTDGNVWTPAATSTYGNVGGITTYGWEVAYGKDALGAGLWVAVGLSGVIAKSTDGNVWTSAAGAATNKGDINFSGRGVAFKNEVISTNTNAPNFLTTNNDSPSTIYRWVVMSSSGKYILAIDSNNNQMYLSTNFGANFSIISFFTGKTFIMASSISSTGQYMIVGQSAGFLYKSSDYGVNWAQVTTLSKAWMSIVLSGDGKYCLTCDSTNNYILLNFDNATPTFVTKTIFTNMAGVFLGSNAISSTGQYMIQINPYGSTDPGIIISSNYGSTFTKLPAVDTIGIAGTNNTYFSSIAMTSDGSTVYITVNGNGLYKSFNLWSGSPSFTKITSAAFSIYNAYTSVQVSSDGTYVVLVLSGYVYYSKNNGVTWTQNYYSYYNRLAALSQDDARICTIIQSQLSKIVLSNT